MTTKLPLVMALIPAFMLAPVMARAETALAVSDAYAFATAEGAKAGAAFMTITYPTGADIVPDRLTAAETPVAGKAEIHTMTLDNNVMTMRQVESFPLPPTGSFQLKPQGVHVMLMDLKQGLKKGETFPLTLTFAKAGTVKTMVTVRAPGDIPASGTTAEPPEEHEVHQDLNQGMDHSGHGM